MEIRNMSIATAKIEMSMFVISTVTIGENGALTS
jgi:hypothetical protein